MSKVYSCSHFCTFVGHLGCVDCLSTGRADIYLFSKIKPRSANKNKYFGSESQFSVMSESEILGTSTPPKTLSTFISFFTLFWTFQDCFLIDRDGPLNSSKRFDFFPYNTFCVMVSNHNLWIIQVSLLECRLLLVFSAVSLINYAIPINE